LTQTLSDLNPLNNICVCVRASTQKHTYTHTHTTHIYMYIYIYNIMVTHETLSQLWRSSACYDDNERVGGVWGERGYVDTLKVGRLIKTHICILQLGLVTPCFALQWALLVGAILK